ncbi:MAG: hypothetical protein WAL23_09180, partial [Nitrososphaeraceae archaeon]
WFSALDPIDAKQPQIPRNARWYAEMSQAVNGVESNLVAAKELVIAVIANTTTILGFDTSM